MDRILKISVVIALIIGVGIIVLTVPVIVRRPSLLNYSREVPFTDIPKDVPIINGKIVSSKTFRSDDLTRGIEIVVETNFSLQEAVQYYSEEFTKRDISVDTLPTFQGNAREIENFTEAYAIAETKSHIGIVVTLERQPQFTKVTIQVKGNSILFLPNTK